MNNLFTQLSEDDEILCEVTNPSDGDTYYFVFEKASDSFSFKQTSKAGIESFKQFIHKHPFLSGVAIRTGIDAIASYKNNKKLTSRFFAKTPYEKQLYKQMSDDLINTGKYDLVRKRHMHGGILYELKRKGWQ